MRDAELRFAESTGAGASKSNLYAVQSNASIFGWNSAGTALAGWPVTTGSGETCGVDVTSSGEVWGGHYSTQSVRKFTAGVAGSGEISIGTSFCKLATDQSNNDLYIQPYSGGPVRKYTAARLLPARGAGARRSPRVGPHNHTASGHPRTTPTRKARG